MSGPVDVLAALDHMIDVIGYDLVDERKAVADLIEAAKHGREWIIEFGDRNCLPNGGILHRLDAALTRAGGAA